MASTKSQAQTRAETDALALYKAAWGEASKDHSKRCKRYDEAERAYRAQMPKDKKLGYAHDLRPHYCFETIDMLVAAIVDDEAKVIVKPKQQSYEAGAKLHQKILEQQRERDERTDKLTQFATHSFVYNLGVAKIGWDYYQREVKVRRWDSTSPEALAAGKPVETDPQVVTQTVCNQPSMTLIEPRDFLIDPRARTIGEAGYCLARFYVTKQSLVDAGVYKNLDQVSEAKGDQPSSGSSAGSRPKSVTLVEYWTPERLIAVANDAVVVRDDQDVYEHGELPFIVASPLPDLRSLAEGFSLVDVIAPLQFALWRSICQRLDMGDVVLNPPAWYDPNTFQGEKSQLAFGPGARIPGMPDQQWGVFAGMPTSVLAAAIENEQPIKNDLHEIAAVEPFFAGASDQQTDPKTATQINAVTSMVQLRMKKMRRVFAAQGRRAGMLEVAMNKQLLRQADVIRLDKKDAWEWQPFTLDDIQGDYDVVASDEDENINQQKRREEASLLTTTLTPMILQAPQNPALLPLIEMTLDAFDREEEKDAIISALEGVIAQQQAAAEAAAQAAAMQPAVGAAPGGSPGPGAAAGSSSPTTAFAAGGGGSLPSFAPRPPALRRV